MSVSRLEADLELKASAFDFLKIFATKPSELANVAPDIIQSIEVVSGDLGSLGFVIIVYYTVGGKDCVAKEVVESLDLLNLSITFKVIEGDLLEKYNSFRFIISVSPKIFGGSVVHWTLEYEKPNEDTSDPNRLLEEVLQVSKDLDDYLSNLL